MGLFIRVIEVPLEEKQSVLLRAAQSATDGTFYADSNEF